MLSTVVKTFIKKFALKLLESLKFCFLKNIIFFKIILNIIIGAHSIILLLLAFFFPERNCKYKIRLNYQAPPSGSKIKLRKKNHRTWFIVLYIHSPHQNLGIKLFVSKQLNSMLFYIYILLHDYYFPYSNKYF